MSSSSSSSLSSSVSKKRKKEEMIAEWLLEEDDSDIVLKEPEEETDLEYDRKLHQLEKEQEEEEQTEKEKKKKERKEKREMILKRRKLYPKLTSEEIAKSETGLEYWKQANTLQRKTLLRQMKADTIRDFNDLIVETRRIENDDLFEQYPQLQRLWTYPNSITNTLEISSSSSSSSSSTATEHSECPRAQIVGKLEVEETEKRWIVQRREDQCYAVLGLAYAYSVLKYKNIEPNDVNHWILHSITHSVSADYLERSDISSIILYMSPPRHEEWNYPYKWNGRKWKYSGSTELTPQQKQQLDGLEIRYSLCEKAISLYGAVQFARLNSSILIPDLWELVYRYLI